MPGRSGSSPPAARPSEPVHERAGRVTGAGMNDEAGGLVDDEQVLVLERDS